MSFHHIGEKGWVALVHVFEAGDCQIPGWLRLEAGQDIDFATFEELQLH